ncbi:MAG TPA: transposase [Clostridiales bacterium]|nr:MAG: hypothetical protein A2Y22_04000 [Clostridiales bacterium GWD2_32_59]HAN09730.1 transposase [Clostridiales bacterium]
MPRKRREISSTGIYHIMLRGNEKKNIFIDEIDKYKFIKVLREKVFMTNSIIYAYCLMDNHVHIIVKENTISISELIKSINVNYVGYFNKKYNRIGHLFADRFKSEVIESEKYLLTVIRYLHNNPIKAGIVDKVDEYKWSSISEYLGDNSFVQSGDIFKIIDENVICARKEFIRFSQNFVDDNVMDY